MVLATSKGARVVVGVTSPVSALHEFPVDSVREQASFVGADVVHHVSMMLTDIRLMMRNFFIVSIIDKTSSMLYQMSYRYQD
jgi:hypothetical protein